LHPIAKTCAPVLHLAFTPQDAQFARAFAILKEAISARAFPGAALAITQRGHLLALKAFGRFTYAPTSPVVQPDTIFDLASVSKVVATTTVAMLLYERGQLDLEQPVVEILPEFSANSTDSRRGEVTLRRLLAHSSGLPGYERLFQRAQTAAEVRRAALTTPLTAQPGSRAEYSDIGFIVLGEALARLAGDPLDTYCQREVFGPWGMTRTGYCPPASCRQAIPPSADDREFRHRIIQGEVNDENAGVLGGVAGHAGVFAPAADLALFAQCLLNGGPPILHPPTIATFTTRQESPAKTSWALGWDTPSPPSQSGQYFSRNSFGHLGYTGTSLWIDPERQVSVTLLTNRTWPDHTCQAIKEVRPRFHDAAIEALS
jgi:serine-type D-Ala-D-Ala carboxypeptidase